MKFSKICRKTNFLILVISSILFLPFFVKYIEGNKQQQNILNEWEDDTTNENLHRMVALYPEAMLTSLTDPVELNILRWHQPSVNKRSNQPSVGKRLFLARIGKRGMMMPIYRARVG
ncbi:hypothetical protein ACQ4LE_011010 [Meloidogyne hapla]|uniref:Uncharacterized protein n=1 Tax=Meloidogyne hapla TaxID=6305 RepID=A0A1I8B0J6_MELHA